MIIITDEEQKKILSLKVRSVEKMLGITGKELARRCGVSDNTIYRIDGRRKSNAGITEKTIRVIAEKTGVSFDWLLDFNDENVDNVPLLNMFDKDMPTDTRTPGERVREFRAELSMSQQAFAESAGIGKSALAAIETGQNRLTEQIARKIEGVYEHAGAEWLLNGDERNKHYPVSEDMINWLKNHQEARELIWVMMHKTEPE